MSRILIVEDEEVLTASLQDILTYEGHQVTTALTGREALEKLRTEELELVLLDLMIPLVDGVTVLQTLRRERPTTRVVVVTSCGREALQGLPVEGFLRKPFSLDALLRLVDSTLEQSAASGK